MTLLEKTELLAMKDSRILQTHQDIDDGKMKGVAADDLP